MSDQERHAREFHGLVRILGELGKAAENVFSRVYGGLTRRENKLMVDAEKLQRFRQQHENVRQKARAQAMEIARLAGIMGVIDEGVVMQNPEGRITLMNEAARALLGTTKNFWQSDLGKLFKEARSVPAGDSQMQTVGKPQRFAVNNLILGVKLAAIHSPKGELLGTVMMLRDVTQDSVADRLKDSFVGHMSHELRTPLTAIKGMSDVLLNLPEGKPPRKSFMEAISRNVAILDRMVVELLDISEITGGTFHIEQDVLPLDDLAFTVLKGFEPRIASSKLHTTSMITNHRALQIVGDHRRLQWALGHLVDNAINYTLPGGDIVLQMGKVRDQHVLLEVEDTGVGIQEKDLPRIFERFFRGEPRSQEGKVLDPRGLGQGLFIAQRVIEAHGGYVTVASTLGEGSTFTVALPIAS